MHKCTFELFQVSCVPSPCTPSHAHGSSPSHTCRFLWPGTNMGRPDRTSGFHHPPETAVSSQNQTDSSPPHKGYHPLLWRQAFLRPGALVYTCYVLRKHGGGGNNERGETTKIRGTVKESQGKEIHLVKSHFKPVCS